MAEKKPPTTLLNRIKKMMQQDDDVGKVAKGAPVLIAKAMDVFMEGLVAGAVGVAEGRGAKMLTASHLKAHIESEQVLDFLKALVAEVPDLPPPGQEEPPVKSPRGKRSRPASDEQEAGPPAPKAAGRGHGRGGGGGRGRGRVRGKRAAAAAEPEEGVGELDEVAAPEAGPDAEMPAAEQQPLQEEPQALAGSNGAAAEAPAPAEQQQEQHLAAAEEAAAPAVAVPAFLAAAVAVQGADAEVEDYDE